MENNPSVQMKKTVPGKAASSVKNSDPLVSIVCDTFQHAPYIRDTLDGFLLQKTTFPIEIIVHDDASFDGTADIVREYETAHPEIFRCVYRKENLYSHDPKILEHYVFPLARGKYIAICEGDDYWTDPDKLQRQIDYMEAHPECTLCVTAAEMVDPAKKHVGWVMPYTEDCDIPMEELIRGGGGFVPTASIVAPTRLAKERAAFCDMVDVDDAVLQLWFGANGVTHYFANSSCAYRYEVPGSWTKTFFASNPKARISHHENMIRALKSFDKETGERWHEAVEYCVIHQQEFEVLRLRNDVQALRRPPYREQYKQLPLKRRIRMYLAKRNLIGE
ncbi:MAG: glycosyltransferase [Eubacteriales bacterium]|nr:glycosyltransferase [Eubacteriales bacterium]